MTAVGLHVGALAFAAFSTACSGLQPTATRSPAPAPAPIVREESDSAAAAAAATAPNAAEGGVGSPPSSPIAAPAPPAAAAATRSGASVSNAANASPPCLPQSARAKPRRKPQPKVVARDTSAPLSSTTAFEAAPPGGVVDAQVRAMPVSVMSILGKRVLGPQGDDLGRVVDVLADASGRVRIAIVDFGGFLGVGDRRIAVDWPLLRFNPEGGDTSLLLSVSREKLQSTPVYKYNPRPQTLMEPAPDPGK